MVVLLVAFAVECLGYVVQTHPVQLNYTVARVMCNSGSIFNPMNRYHTSECAIKHLKSQSVQDGIHYSYFTNDPNKVLQVEQNTTWYDSILIDRNVTQHYLPACFGKNLME